MVSAMSASDDQPDRKQAAAAAKEILDVAEQMAAMKPHDVVWVSERERFGRWLVVAPLDVALLMRDKIFGETPTVLTSATLKIGGDFETLARTVGLSRNERLDVGDAEPDDPDAITWRALDVGSPFDYAAQGILYVAARLPGDRSRGGRGGHRKILADQSLPERQPRAGRVSRSVRRASAAPHPTCRLPPPSGPPSRRPGAAAPTAARRPLRGRRTACCPSRGVVATP